MRHGALKQVLLTFKKYIIMYKLQWAYLINKDGSNIPATDLVYNDTEFVYEDIEDAEHDRLILMEIQKNAAKQNVKYFKVVKM